MRKQTLVAGYTKHRRRLLQTGTCCYARTTTYSRLHRLYLTWSGASINYSCECNTCTCNPTFRSFIKGRLLATLGIVFKSREHLTKNTFLHPVPLVVEQGPFLVSYAALCSIGAIQLHSFFIIHKVIGDL